MKAEELKKYLTDNGIPYYEGMWQKAYAAIAIESEHGRIVFSFSPSGEVWDCYLGGREYNRLRDWNIRGLSIYEYAKIGDFKKMVIREIDLTPYKARRTA